MNKSTKRMATITGIGMLAGSFAVGVMFVSVQQEKSDVSFLLARNIVALAQNEDATNCGSPTVYYNEALRSENCGVSHIHAANYRTQLVCKNEEGKCCDSNSQTDCE